MTRSERPSMTALTVVVPIVTVLAVIVTASSWLGRAFPGGMDLKSWVLASVFGLVVAVGPAVVLFVLGVR